eukprot:TRINITY_DN62766_c0_g1_i1.p1 TRINITY_DN62766_c0_g1~~TRINITY_DN62766_c0_g1_i1.p1  ORF type:complete len:394 (+),score=77.27 TRINITY_DN62766_c0_g1_i1:46-1227(+)
MMFTTAPLASCVIAALFAALCTSLQIDKADKVDKASYGVHRCAENDECNTHWISKYGIMMSMDVHPLNTKSDTSSIAASDYDSVTRAMVASHTNGTLDLGSTFSASGYLAHMKKRGRGATVYVVSSALSAFISEVFPDIHEPFVLVTGDAIKAVPDEIMGEVEFESFINDERIMHWFSQNGHSEHEKFTRIPNGLDYHTLYRGSGNTWGSSKSPQEQEAELDDVVSNALPFKDRKDMALAGPWSSGYAGRTELSSALYYAQAFEYTTTKSTRVELWQRFGGYKFVVSPRGAGWDCHRTWEALIIGCIPMVDATGIDPMWAAHSLPVAVVDDWNELSKLSAKEIEDKFANVVELREKSAKPEALTLKYWLDIIEQGAKGKGAVMAYMKRLRATP